MINISSSDSKNIQTYDRRPIRYSRYKLCNILILVILFSVTFGITHVFAVEKKKVLVLHSYHQEFPWTDSVMHGMRSGFAKSSQEIELYVEYLDLKRHQAKTSHPHLLSLFRERYLNTRFDMIILSDDFALNFVLDYRNELFPGVPVVFCGINNFSESRIAGQNEITGVAEDIDIVGTLKLILTIHPNVRKVAVINDGTPPAIDMMKRVRQSMPLVKNLKLIELFDLSVVDLKQALQKLPEDTAILHLHYYYDKETGKALTLEQSFAITLGNSNLPIYTGWDFQIGFGALGGMVVSGEVQGRSAAEMANKILDGASVASIPPLTKSPNISMFDYNYMKHFGIKKKDLPQGSIILNEPLSFYYQYKLIIWLVVGVVFILSFFNLALLISIRRRKNAEKKSLILKAAVDQAPAGIALADKDSNVYYCNPEALGMRRGALKDLAEIPKDVFSNWQVLMLNGKPYEMQDLPLVRAITERKTIKEELIVRHQDGSDHICEASAYPVYENGKISGGMIIFLDITERKTIEKNLVTQERFISAIADTSPAIIYVYDMESNRNVYSNSGMERLIGYSSQEIKDMGKNVLNDLVHPDDFPKIVEAHSTICDTSDLETISLEYRMKHRNGTWLSLHSHERVFLRNNDGSVKQKIGVAFDVTDLKKARDERDELQAKLMQSQKMESIGTLAGGIAHEFNNMLAIIMGNNELITEDLPQGSLAKESTEEIRIAGMRARDVVKQLLTFSRQDNTVTKVMDLTSVVQESMKLIRSSTPVNIKFDINFSADTYPVMGNETQMNQLLINLCNNAIDAVPDEGGIITIQLLNETIDIQQAIHQAKLAPGQYAKLIVSDNGIGMEPEILGRVFEPYFTTKDIGEGSGIGMAVVHGIVERHGGEIAVDSKLGVGTTFTILLPVYEGLFEHAIVEQDILPIGDEHILYVDDEPSIAKIGKRILDSLGYTTDSTTDPEKALDMVRNNPNKFDLLITDMAMPNMTGDQLVIETLKIRQDIPTIICTGYSAKITEKEVMDIGVRSYVMKPINKSELAVTVRQVLDGAKVDNLKAP